MAFDAGAKRLLLPMASVKGAFRQFLVSYLPSSRRSSTPIQWMRFSKCWVPNKLAMTTATRHTAQPRNQEAPRHSLQAIEGSKSFLAAEAITAFLDLEDWQLGEIRTGFQNRIPDRPSATIRPQSG